MDKNLKISLGLFILVLALLIVYLAYPFHKESPVTDQSKLPLSSKEVSQLTQIINAEYKARDTYWRINENFDNPAPFEFIENAKAQHIDNIKVVFSNYQVVPPQDSWYSKVKIYSNFDLACQAGVFQEQELIQLYNELTPDISNADILELVNYLRADAENHLSDFQECS